MKKLLSIVTLLSATVFAANAQTADVKTKIDNQIIKMFDGKAVVVETENKNNLFELEVIHQSIEKEIIFTSAGEWQSTSYDIPKSDLPEKIKAVIKASKYSSYSIDDVDVIITPLKSVYKIDLDKLFGDDITIYVTFEGEIL